MIQYDYMNFVYFILKINLFFWNYKRWNTKQKNKKATSCGCFDGNPAVFIRNFIKSFATPQLPTCSVLSSPGKMEHETKTKKQPRAVALMVIQQCSIFPGRRQPSIFDDKKLNFCVRYENRWILLSIATGSGIITEINSEIIIIRINKTLTTTY